MTSVRYDVLGIGNAIVDVIARAEDDFLVKQGMQKGGMALIDEARAQAIYAAMGPAVESSGGSAANTIVGVASFGARAAFVGKVKEDELGRAFAHDIRAANVAFDTKAANGGPSTARCYIMTTTLLAKDTAHRTVYPVFTPGGGFAMAEMQGGGDFLMVADPSTFRILPWANKTGWMLCDIYFGNGKAVPFSTRARCKDAVNALAKAGFNFRAGLEVEFHLFKLENPRLSPTDATWPPEAPQVSLLTQGYQYLTESRFDMMMILW